MHSTNRPLAVFFLCLCLLAATALMAQQTGGASMEIRSNAFEAQGMIPARYTCDDANVSPPLDWSGVPEKTRSLALICDDPDAPAGTWVHWVYYDIPPTLDGLPEAVARDDRPAPGGTQGINDFRRIGYGGPCPPSGTHRYDFKLYALDRMLGLDPGASKKELLARMKDHVLAEAALMSRYRRQH